MTSISKPGTGWATTPAFCPATERDLNEDDPADYDATLGGQAATYRGPLPTPWGATVMVGGACLCRECWPNNPRTRYVLRSDNLVITHVRRSWFTVLRPGVKTDNP